MSTIFIFLNPLLSIYVHIISHLNLMRKSNHPSPPLLTMLRRTGNDRYAHLDALGHFRWLVHALGYAEAFGLDEMDVFG